MDNQLSDSPFFVVQIAGERESDPAFEIGIPRDCHQFPAESIPASGIFVPIAHFVSTSDREFELSVFVTNLPREISAADLTELDASERGAKLTHRCGDTSDQAEQIEMMERSGKTWLVRSKVICHGKLAFRVQACAPSDCREDVAEACAKSVVSFKVLTEDPIEPVEPRAKFAFNDGIEVEFEYPESWELAITTTDTDSTRCRLRNANDGDVVGEIEVQILSDTPNESPATPFRAYADRLMQDGIRLSGAALVPLDPPGGYKACVGYAPTASKNGEEISVGAMLLEHPDARMFVGISGVSKRTAPAWWAINRRAFEIVRDSLRVPASQSSSV